MSSFVDGVGSARRRGAGAGASVGIGARVLAVVTAVVGLLALGGALARPAGGHTDLLQGSPGPGQRVGGTVDFVDLVFMGPVTDVVIEVTDPDGEVVAGEMVVADGQIITIEMDPVVDTGRHVVSYEMISEDGDETTGSYFFTYEEGATQPFRLSQLDVPDPPSETADTIRTVATIVAVVALAALCAVLFVLLRQRQAELAARRKASTSSRS